MAPLTIQEITEAFKEVLANAGIIVDEVRSGGMQRVGTIGKERGKDGAYVFHSDHPASGWYMNYRTGESSNWTAATTRQLTSEEQTILRSRIENDKKQREAETVRRHAEAREKSQALRERLPRALNDHPYLQAKGVSVVDGIYNDDEKLVVFLQDDNGQIHSYQRIYPNGDKRFLSGGRKQGCFFPIQGNDGPLYIVEGVATGLSVHEATGAEVWCAFDCGNLKAVAESARKKHPSREIVIAGDNDLKTDGNPGKVKAEEAAFAIGALCVVPFFEDRPDLSDFNDLHMLSGLQAVKDRLVAAVKVNNSPIHSCNIEEFLSMNIPEREMILAPVIQTQGLAMLYAERGCGKTFLALYMALCVAAGCRCLGNSWFAPKARKVLYVDGEMAAREMQKRMSQLCLGLPFGMVDKEKFQIITPDLQDEPMPNLASPEGQAMIEANLHGVNLLVLDNLSTLCSGGEENKAESWQPIQDWLLRLRRKGVAVLMVHHSNKNGSQRGTSKREDTLDTSIRLNRPADYEPEQGAKAEVHIMKGRGIVGEDAKPFIVELTQTPDGGLTWAVSSLEDALLEQIKELLDAGNNQREVADALGISQSKVCRLNKQIEVA